MVRRSAPQEGFARDFALADAELSLLRPRVQANGKVVASSPVGTSGQVVWDDSPGQGGSAYPYFPMKRGFGRNGAAEADEFTFRQGSTEYRVGCSGPVALGSGRYNLYVRFEPGWYPGPDDTFLIGSNSLEDSPNRPSRGTDRIRGTGRGILTGWLRQPGRSFFAVGDERKSAAWAKSDPSEPIPVVGFSETEGRLGGPAPALSDNAVYRPFPVGPAAEGR